MPRLAALALALCLLWPTASAAAPAIPSSYDVWPPAIRVVAPIAGGYVLVGHAPEGPILVGPWMLEQGWVSHFPLPRADIPYHVQVAETRAGEQQAIWQTPRYTVAAHVVFLPGVRR